MIVATAKERKRWGRWGVSLKKRKILQLYNVLFLLLKNCFWSEHGHISRCFFPEHRAQVLEILFYILYCIERIFPSIKKKPTELLFMWLKSYTQHIFILTVLLRFVLLCFVLLLSCQGEGTAFIYSWPKTKQNKKASFTIQLCDDDLCKELPRRFPNASPGKKPALAAISVRSRDLGPRAWTSGPGLGAPEPPCTLVAPPAEGSVFCAVTAVGVSEQCSAHL